MPGTKLDDPVGPDQRPDLAASGHEIEEYLQEQGAYDLFHNLLKDLLTKQPDDPLQHMIDRLSVARPTDLLQVIITSPPGLGRSALARQLAHHFGLEYIGAAELLQEGGADAATMGYEEEAEVAEMVMQRVQYASEHMRGFVLDGFPRTRFQASFLKERSVVPTHVLELKATPEQILERQRLIQEGALQEENELVTGQDLEQRIHLYSSHRASVLEAYKGKLTIIDTTEGEEMVWEAMEKAVRVLPRSLGPKTPPRIVLLGPRGIGAREHASRLALQLGAVFVDALELEAMFGDSSSVPRRRRSTTLDVPNLRPKVAQDPLREVGVRLRLPDCEKQGWVMCGFPKTLAAAQQLRQDPRLTPNRVVHLHASVETCVSRLRHFWMDPLTDKVWTRLPNSEAIRKRLQRAPEHMPAAVESDHADFSSSVGAILEALGTDGRCVTLQADGPPQGVFHELVEFVERPLCLPPVQH